MKYLPFVAPPLICIPIATYLIFCKLAETRDLYFKIRFNFSTYLYLWYAEKLKNRN